MEIYLEALTVPIPALLRAARGSYAAAIRQRLVAAGFADLPRNSAYVLGGLVNQGGTVQNLVRELGVSKQAASQLVDSLVGLGYLERREDLADRRRITITATARGSAAATEVRAGVRAVDEKLASLLRADELHGLRAGLVALCTIREGLEDGARAGR